MAIKISGPQGGAGGATTLNGLTDVSISSVQNSQVIQYNSTSGDWENSDLNITGGLTYKGTFNATTGAPSLANAEQGDFYLIDTAGTIFGQTWAINDHLLINTDMGGSITNSKIDKIDNTDQVTSVNGQTGAVTGLLEASSNLSDVSNAGTARSNLGAIAEVVEDTSPQLGGALDVNGQAIVSASAGNIAITPDTTGSIVLDGLNWPQADGSADQVLKTNGSGQLSFVDQTTAPVTSVNGATGAVTGLLENVVEDTSPQLGGALDVNGQAIVSASAGDIAITPDTTGSIVLDGLNWPQADGSADQVLKTNGSGQLSFVDQAAGAVTSVNGQTGAVTGLLENVVEDTSPQLGGALDVNGQAIVSASAGDIAITPDTTGSIVLDGLNWPQADGSADQVLKTNGSGQLSFVDQAAGAVTSVNGQTGAVTGLLENVVEDTSPQLGGALDVNGQAIVSASAGNIAITPDTTGSIVLDGLNWPQADGSAGQVLKTNGSGQLSFVDQSSGAVTSVNGQTGAVTGLLENVVEDTSPQLGGALDVNGQAIVSASAGDIAITPDTTGSIVLDGLNWPQADGSADQVLKTNGSGQLSFVDQTAAPVTSVNGQTGAVTGLLENVVEDTSPQLGGDLDVQVRIVTTSTSNGSIGLEPDGTGSVVARGTGSGNTPGTLTLNCEENTHGVALQSPPHSSGASYTLKLPTGVGTNGQALTSDGNNPAQLAWTTISGGSGSRPTVTTDSSGTDSTISDPAAADLEDIFLIDNGANAVTITLPTVTSNSGYQVQIKRLGTANVTISCAGSATIDDGATTSRVLTVQFASFTLVSDGTDWFII